MSFQEHANINETDTFDLGDNDEIQFDDTGYDDEGIDDIQIEFIVSKYCSTVWIFAITC